MYSIRNRYLMYEMDLYTPTVNKIVQEDKWVCNVNVVGEQWSSKISSKQIMKSISSRYTTQHSHLLQPLDILVSHSTLNGTFFGIKGGIM